MKLYSVLLAAAVCLALAGCGGGGNGDAGVGDGGPGVLPPPTQDSDDDFIPDVVEGWPDRDSDGDGQPDFLDTDADGDSIIDRLEAGDTELSTPPVDSDADGTPDYLDDDSDDNGLIDRIEGADDTDGDGILNFADPDDDNDRIDDIVEIGDGSFPRDTDADGVPDFRDRDSDGDFILDRTERGGAAGTDSDNDGVPDVLDLDSDGDGIPDAEEAGDNDLETPPVDTDMDGLPDYLDLDSDADGLRDDLEAELGTDPTNNDSDGDGVTDLIEVGAGTDPNDAADNPRVRGDFVFEVPFREDADPREDTLRFRTNIRRVDLYLLTDTTGSMITEISTIKSRMVELLDLLTCESSLTPCTGDLGCTDGEICNFDGVCIEDPSISGCIPDLWTGVGTYAGGGNSFRNLLSLQPDSVVTRDAFPGAADGPGFAESLFETAACIADPTACFGALCGNPRDGVGCPTFRRDAVRILAFITDEMNECESEDNGDPPCVNVNTAGAAGGRLSLQKIRFLGIDADSGNEPRADLRALGLASGSVDTNGEPFYFEGSESDVANALVEGISQIAAELSLFVDIEAADLTGDDGDALQFIQRLEVDTTTFGCSDPGGYADTNDDGFDDAFSNLRTGNSVCWRLIARNNTRVPELAARPQIFRAQLTVFGDGSPLDRRQVFFLVPPSGDFCGPDDPRPQCRDEEEDD